MSGSVSINKVPIQSSVAPGDPAGFTLTIVVTNNVPEEQVYITNFADLLANFPSNQGWTITSQSGPDPFAYFQINAPYLDFLLNDTYFTTGTFTYSVTYQTNTNLFDASAVLDNSATLNYTTLNSKGEPVIIGELIGSNATVSIEVCIHKTSMITLPGGKEKMICDLEPGEEIMGADGSVTQIVQVVPCWTVDPFNNCGQCAIFEPDSLGPGIPSKRFAVDHGHPIQTQEHYNEYANDGLKPAKLFLNQNDNIYSTMWDKVADLLPGENKRYDIIMKEDSCKAYLANGIVVKSRKSRKIPGYEYS